jgi:hypothetical protein
MPFVVAAAGLVNTRDSDVPMFLPNPRSLCRRGWLAQLWLSCSSGYFGVQLDKHAVLTLVIK